MLCDSLPGGGQIRGYIDEVAADIDLYSGSGPLRNIEVTVTCAELAGSAFNPPLPQTRLTNVKGRARFGHIDITAAPETKFFLYFSATDPVNGLPLACMCGEYELLARGHKNSPAILSGFE